MITRLREPDPASPTERTPGRGEGLALFAQAVERHVFPDALSDLSVLDVGGADGWLWAFLSRWQRPRAPRAYWCLDRRLSDWWRNILADAHALPFRDASVDVVVSKQTLPHFRDPGQACREMVRVARRLVVVRQEWPVAHLEGGDPQYEPVGWVGHSRVRIDGPEDVLLALRHPDWVVDYDGVDFVARRMENP